MKMASPGQPCAIGAGLPHHDTHRSLSWFGDAFAALRTLRQAQGPQRLQMLLTMTIILSLAACSSSKPEDAATAPADKPATSQTAITLTADQVKAAGIQLGMPVMQLMHRHLLLNGKLVASPESRADITSSINGTVQKLLVRPGQQVNENQVVAVLSHPDILKLQEQYLTTRPNLAFLEAEWRRQQALKGEKAGTEKAFQRAEADFKAESARLASLAAQLRLIGLDPDKLAQSNTPVAEIQLRSMVSGTVGQVLASLGSMVQPGQVLMSVQSNRRLVAEGNAFEKDLPALKIGLTADLRLVQGGISVPARITGMGGAMQAETRSVSVYLEPTQSLPAGWVAGASIAATVDAGKQQSQVVPEGALAQQGSEQVVFLTTDGTSFTPVAVTVGATADGFTEILSPDLSALTVNGRKVVTAGAFYVQSHKAVSEGEE